MECDQLLPGEPDPGGPHDVHPQLHPLLHLHERQVLHCPVTQDGEVVKCTVDSAVANKRCGSLVCCIGNRFMVNIYYKIASHEEYIKTREEPLESFKQVVRSSEDTKSLMPI